jgi:ABC-type transport system involved in multi-copper enzyme maturation permease subunit
MHAALAIAAATVLEARRTRLAWVLGAVLLGALGLAVFLGKLALTESGELQAALLAALLRFASVLLVATFVVTSTQREANDKGRDLLLALPVSRAAYLLGKLAGFGLVALFPALLSGVLAAQFAPAGQAAAWSISLLIELWIVAAFSLLCAQGFRHAFPALGATAAFYLLARSAGTLQLLGHGNPLADAIAALLPHLDRFARTEWLVYHTGSVAQLWPQLAQGAIYLALLAAAALFDLYRKDI